jgi:hypothetical protein
VNVVLHGDGDAVQRAAQLSLRPLAIALLGFAQRVRVDRHHCVELFVIERDAREILLHQLARREATLRHRLLHVCDARFDGLEFARRRERRKQQNDQPSLHRTFSQPIAAA